MSCLPDRVEIKTSWALAFLLAFMLIPFINFVAIKDNYREIESQSVLRQQIVYFQLEITKAQNSLFLLMNRRNVIDDRLFELEVEVCNGCKTKTAYTLIKERYTRERERIQIRIIERRAEIHDLYSRMRDLDNVIPGPKVPPPLTLSPDPDTEKDKKTLP
jgi:phosphoglycerate-specific signal transduction histidine kinase